jgi:hypothetical protein
MPATQSSVAVDGGAERAASPPFVGDVLMYDGELMQLMLALMTMIWSLGCQSVL